MRRVVSRDTRTLLGARVGTAVNINIVLRIEEDGARTLTWLAIERAKGRTNKSSGGYFYDFSNMDKFILYVCTAGTAP